MQLDLNSPNFLNANKNAHESLSELQEVFGNDQAIVDLRNSNGELKIPKERIEPYTEYIEAGGGAWKLTVELNGSKRRRSSSDESVKISVEMDGESIEVELRSALDQFRDQL